MCIERVEVYRGKITCAKFPKVCLHGFFVTKTKACSTHWQLRLMCPMELFSTKKIHFQFFFGLILTFFVSFLIDKYLWLGFWMFLNIKLLCVIHHFATNRLNWHNCSVTTVIFKVCVWLLYLSPNKTMKESNWSVVEWSNRSIKSSRPII